MTAQMPERHAKEQAKERDDHQCRFCGMSREEHKERFGKDLHAHHIIKENDGGPDHPHNFITVCRNCHTTLEKTQADALSQIRENILDAVSDEFISAEEIDAIIEATETDPEGEELENEVRIGYYYYHNSYGLVKVFDIHSETVAASTDGTQESIVVEYSCLDRDDSHALTDYIDHFADSVRYGSEYSTDVRDDADGWDST